jgi:hypothetical protein
MINKKGPNVYSSTRDEKSLDVALKILSRAVPESQTDAMSDYSKSLRFLRQIKDPRIQPLISELEDVYAYPERQTHNSVISGLHDFREKLHEEKLKRKTAEESPKLSGLGAAVGNLSAAKMVGLLAVFVVLWNILPTAK